MSRDILKDKSIETARKERQKDEHWWPGVDRGNTVTTTGTRDLFGVMEKP